MKRLWVGLCVLGLLLGLGVLTAWGMDRVLEPVSRLLALASQAALEENWTEAEALAADAKTRWEQLRGVAAAAADHAPLEQIDALFAQLRVYSRQRDAVHFAACCSQLGALTNSVGEAHSVSWQNLLQQSLGPVPGSPQPMLLPLPGLRKMYPLRPLPQ